MPIRRPRPTVGPTPEPTPEPGSDALIRYVQDGVPSVAPEGSSVGEALDFAASAPDRMAMFFYPMPRRADLLALGLNMV